MSSMSFVSHFGVPTKVVSNNNMSFKLKDTKKYYIEFSFG